uniref:C3H1-type domain-containing protein n=1 Tax=Chromera velia CCMP2878 TaxID=1169474 RepID=A0A0G4HNJ2_9ALVE|eukprot:Cvel_7649.t1-p1 / transcript=Cvel_7649.t1 / gene=Cvel_7649 / organism=Chromera_velia_CCMP2878 / gene_product=Zinc finger CCCH domain-containing protein 9, putative / transcript_product=Zinc finger CCCH domain-containing protein 9, putative / location=Cvel_scaffold405:4397-8049(-) / protein_length=618 / sequence_SO=supercontig / SO=protein_coding / is_pseudo=false
MAPERERERQAGGVTGPEAASAAASVNLKNELYRNAITKTKICRHWKTGFCQMGSNCRFAHGDFEVMPPPDLRHTVMCNSVMRKRPCRSGANCNFAHTVDELVAGRLRAEKLYQGTEKDPVKCPEMRDQVRAERMAHLYLRSIAAGSGGGKASSGGLLVLNDSYPSSSASDTPHSGGGGGRPPHRYPPWIAATQQQPSARRGRGGRAFGGSSHDMATVPSSSAPRRGFWGESTRDEEEDFGGAGRGEFAGERRGDKREGRSQAASDRLYQPSYPLPPTHSEPYPPYGRAPETFGPPHPASSSDAPSYYGAQHEGAGRGSGGGPPPHVRRLWGDGSMPPPPSQPSNEGHTGLPPNAPGPPSRPYRPPPRLPPSALSRGFGPSTSTAGGQPPAVPRRQLGVGFGAEDGGGSLHSGTLWGGQNTQKHQRQWSFGEGGRGVQGQGKQGGVNMGPLSIFPWVTSLGGNQNGGAYETGGGGGNGFDFPSSRAPSQEGGGGVGRGGSRGTGGNLMLAPQGGSSGGGPPFLEMTGVGGVDLSFMTGAPGDSGGPPGAAAVFSSSPSAAAAAVAAAAQSHQEHAAAALHWHQLQQQVMLHDVHGAMLPPPYDAAHDESEEAPCTTEH